MSASPPTALDAAAALSAAYVQKHGAPPPSAQAIVWPLAQAMGEGTLSSYFAGTNNFGAMHATSGFAAAHAADPGYGMAALLDHGAGGAAYISRVAIYPSLTTGARAFLDLVERMADLSTIGTTHDYAAALYAHGYFEGTATPATPSAGRLSAWSSGQWLAGDLANIDGYAAAIDRNVPAAMAAVAAASSSSYSGNPSAPSAGDLAPLADRLTPAGSYAPHTLEHAAELLGAAASSPPAGAISLADALASPDGQGVWWFAAPGAAEPVAPETPTGAGSTSSPASALWTAIALAAVVTLGAGALGRSARSMAVR